MTAPSNLKSEALSILGEIPYTFIQLANTNAHNDKRHFITSLRQVYRDIAAAFEEPYPANIGVIAIADDLTRWASMWTFHPHAERWVAQMRHTLHIADQVAGDDDTESLLRWIFKGDAVCPACLGVGCLEYQEDSWDHRCMNTGTVWTWKQYRSAIKSALAKHQGRAA